MKTPLPLLLLFVLILAGGCVTNQGQPNYPASGTFGQPIFTKTEPVPVSGTNTISAAEMLGRKVEPQFPARIVVARLNPLDPQLAGLLERQLETAMKAEARLGDIEWLFTESVPWQTDAKNINISEIQDWAARFQSRYVLLTRYSFNTAERTYWLPAAVTICSLGLIPMPVGGQQSFCTLEFVLMDVATGVFILNAQGRGHTQRTAVWGWVANTGTATRLELSSLKEALNEATPRLRAGLLRFHR